MWVVLIESYLKEFFVNIPIGIYIIAIVFVIWKTAEFYFVRFKGIERKIKSLTTEIENLTKTLKSTIKSTLKEFIIEYNLGKLKGSRICLTEEDKDILRKANFHKLLEEKKDIFIKRFNAIKPKPLTRLDGLEATIVMIMDMEEEGMLNFKKLKEIAYEEGKTKTPLLTMVGVYLWNHIIEPQFKN